MTFGNKLKYFRNLNGIGSAAFGEMLGFKKSNACSRVSHYEKGDKTPKKELVLKMCELLSINPSYLQEAEAENPLKTLQFLFEMDRIYGVDASVNEDGICLNINKNDRSYELISHVIIWQEKQNQLNSGRISADEYERWKGRYPYSTQQLKDILSHEKETTAKINREEMMNK